MDLVYLIRHKTVTVAMDDVRRLRIRRLDEAEDLPRRLVHPVAQVGHAVRARGQIGLVGLGDVGRRDTALDGVCTSMKSPMTVLVSVGRRHSPCLRRLGNDVLV
jgi:hypothetical protein